MHRSNEERCPVGRLISSQEHVPPTVRVERVADRFLAEQDLEALALVDQDRPCGLATRSKVMSILFNRFGFELFGRDPILEIADREPLMVGEDGSLEIVLDKAMRREFRDIYDEIVVVDEAGRFKGLLSVKRLVVEQGNALTQSMVQKEVALAKAREMKKVTDMKPRFIAHVTHELRSPVNAIIGLSELMQLAVEGGAAPSTCALYSPFRSSEVVKATSPDLIILDVNMPALSGDRLCSLLKGHSAAKNLPILLYSSNDEDSLRRSVAEFGADGYVCKGDIAGLRNLVGRKLNG